jgi:hypothetical protein
MYVWGDAAQLHKITCNYWLPFIENDQFLQAYKRDVTENFGITKNLHQLLLHLRKSDEPRRLWIDQICINQTNLEEKSEQIRIMSEIYSGARNVMIWLGEEDPGTEKAFGIMDLMAQFSGMTDEDVGWSVARLLEQDIEVGDENRVRFELLRHILLKYGQPGYLDLQGNQYVALQGIRTFNEFLLERPWFRRAWTFQEAVMARHAKIQCGSRVVDWDVLYNACQYILSSALWIERGPERLGVALIAENVVKQGHLRRDWARIQLLKDENGTKPLKDEKLCCGQ